MTGICPDCGESPACADGECPHVPRAVLDAWAKACRCCPECSPVICGGVQQGAFCERVCRCDEGERWDEHDADLDDEAEEADWLRNGGRP